MYTLPLVLLLAAGPGILAIGAKPRTPYIDYDALPDDAIYPGPWEKYIKAPTNKTFITPSKIYKVRGNVSTSGSDGSDLKPPVGGHVAGSGILLGPGGVLTLEFAENIAGRVCFDVESTNEEPIISLAYSESSWFAGPLPDATTDRQERDLPLELELGNGTGTVCVPPDFVRGGFKYLTISLPYRPAPGGVQRYIWNAVDWIAQRVLGIMGVEAVGQSSLSSYFTSTVYSKAWVSITSLWVNCTAFPSQSNGRAYSGYFYSSNPVLNRVWYAGAYTLQLSTIVPKEGSAIIDYNRLIDGNTSPQGSWYSNFTIAEGKAVTTDGAKRDRMVWPGDMYIAVPGIAVSTYDMAAVRNALDVLFKHQYSDGSLPYAGPPMGYRWEFSDTYHMHTLLGVYNYVLYSGDVDWLRSRWADYNRALEVSISKVDHLGLLHVSSTADWLRPGMTGHNLEASVMLHTVLSKTIELQSWLTERHSTADLALNFSAERALYQARAREKKWRALQTSIENGLARLYCPDTGLFSDNVGRRNCLGEERVDPQDGNSWALISKLDLSAAGLPWKHPKSSERSNETLSKEQFPAARNISFGLRSHWNKFGATCPEFPNTISPFASGFELLGHAASGFVDHAVELALLEWAYLLDGPGFTNSTLAEGFRVDGNVQYPAYWSAARNSHAHGWSSGPTGVLIEYVLGIHLKGPAGKRWEVGPVITEWLAWARGGFATTEGPFEVMIWRAVQETADGGKRRAVVAKVKAPEGTQGVFRFPPQDGAGRTGEDGKSEALIVDGGEGLFVRWEDSGMVKQLEFKEARLFWDESDAGFGAEADDWYRRVVVSFQDGSVLQFDEKWEAKVMEKREAGVVDWAVMDKFYKTPAPRGWTAKLRAEADAEKIGEL